MKQHGTETFPHIYFVLLLFGVWIEGVKAAWQQEVWNQINGETQRNAVWFVEDGDSCYETGWINR